jgi:hypothetical protein
MVYPSILGPYLGSLSTAVMSKRHLPQAGLLRGLPADWLEHDPHVS